MRAFCSLLLSFVMALPASAETLCTLLIDAPTGATLLEEGDCDRPVTPASTFKLPLAVIGYDTGLLIDAETPVFSYRTGDPDWGGAPWRQDTSPTDWLRHSVLWYSRRLTHELGADRLAHYARRFGYGNADFSGDAGHYNGLDRAWIASSLQVSPRQQAVFLRALLRDALPVSPAAMQKTRAIVERRDVAGWQFKGKTGAAFPRRANRSFDYARGWGWYLGWAEKADRQVVFVTLTQATQRKEGSPGNLTRDAFLNEWPGQLD
ncbi:class D beta-lactamase [Sulfitobacter sp. NFXS29]|uniref:class D beta-lactamase n=1 Tax=Sulfitobacter sp. NFXS29 TaxID=2818438 RepID=UPI0032DEDD11